MTKISVIIRTKNEDRWIESCLNAIENQDYQDIEIILVDNESTDKTMEIAQRYNCIITTITDEDFNFSRALNIFGNNSAR